jgi:hypothetical protein
MLILRLLTAYVAASYLFQSTQWFEAQDEGWRSPSTWKRTLVIGLLSYTALWDVGAIIPALLIATGYFGIEGWYAGRRQTTRNIIVATLGQVIVILLVGTWHSGELSALPSIMHRIGGEWNVWIVGLSYLIALEPMGVLIGQITDRWQEELANGDEEQLVGLQSAGRWIGRLERFIILTLIFIGEYNAIGFLIAAKSIFRFKGGVQDGRERKEAEYILIGTLLSFALAITLGIVASSMLG